MDNMWIVWLSVAIFFLLIESITIELVSLWFTGGALVAMALALLDINIGWQTAAFCLLSVGLILVGRPLLSRFLLLNKSRTNVDSLVGTIAIVTKEIAPYQVGEVQINSPGKYWLAVSSDNTKIEAGAKVRVLAVEGVKLIVRIK